VAPLILSRNFTQTFSTLNDDKQYLLKCTSGEYNGRFLYINMSIGGELFGSADPEENQNITMYIENAGLSPFHASIQYTDN